MENLLEKEWNGYSFRLIKKSNYPAVLEHMQNNLYIDLPMHQILGVTPERIYDMDQKLIDILNLEHGSFFAYPTNQPDKVINIPASGPVLTTWS